MNYLRARIINYFNYIMIKVDFAVETKLSGRERNILFVMVFAVLFSINNYIFIDRHTSKIKSAESQIKNIKKTNENYNVTIKKQEEQLQEKIEKYGDISKIMSKADEIGKINHLNKSTNTLDVKSDNVAPDLQSANKAISSENIISLNSIKLMNLVVKNGLVLESLSEIPNILVVESVKENKYDLLLSGDYFKMHNFLSEIESYENIYISDFSLGVSGEKVLYNITINEMVM